jgi:uncharacterized protein YpmB
MHIRKQTKKVIIIIVTIIIIIIITTTTIAIPLTQIYNNNKLNALNSKDCAFLCYTCDDTSRNESHALRFRLSYFPV